MISLLIFAVCVLLVAWVLVLLVEALPLPSGQIKRVLVVVIWVIAIIAILTRLVPLAGL